MPLIRTPRFASSNCTVSFGGSPGFRSLSVVGGFSAASGLDAASLGVRRGTVVLNRGAVDGGDFFTWIKTARYGTAEPRAVTITVFDGARAAAFTLRNARPIKWTGPVLTARGGADVAMEELVLAHEGIEPG